VSAQLFKQLFGVPKEHELTSGDMIFGITTGENILNYSEKDETGKTIAHYHVVEQRTGYPRESGSITWHRTEVKPKQV